MAYKIIFRKLAIEDIDAAVSYLAEKLSAPQAAMELLDALEEAYDQISSFPYSNPLYRSELPLAEETRFVPVKGYVLYYTVVNDTVEIRRFLHGRRDRTPAIVTQ